MNRRKLTIGAAVAVPVLAFAACSGAAEEPATEPAALPTTAAPTSAAPSPSPSPTTQEPTPEPTEEPASDCLDVPGELTAAITRGATDPGDFVPGNAAAYRSPDHGKVYLVALEFAGAGADNVGVWATNSLEAGGGLIMAADGFANEFTDWPDAMTTAAAINAASPGVSEAKDCLPE